MRKNDSIINFILNENYDIENIDYFIDELNITRKQLISKTFKTINAIMGNYTNTQYESSLINKACKFLFCLCEIEEFNDEQVLINRERIKKTRNAMLALANKYRNDILFESANIIDEIILDKGINVEDLIILIKKLIDKKEDINIIKKILSTNRGAIILDDNKLFDYVFNLSLSSISNETDEIYYYISLLKIFYTTKIDRDRYVRMLNVVSDERNIFANEIYSILYGYKRSLSQEEIINKYGIIEKISNPKIVVPTTAIDEKLITIDKESTETRDDAISIKRLRNKFLVGLHIADPGKLIVPHSKSDYIARNNYKCLYLGDQKSTRLFSPKTEKALSLNEGQNRNVLSLYILMNDSGDILDYYLLENSITVKDNLTYNEADNIINCNLNPEYEKELKALYELSLSLSFKNNVKKEYWQKRGKDTSTSKSYNIISEFMVLYNYLLSQITIDKGINYIYRIQEESYFDNLINDLGLNIDENTLKVIHNIYLKSKYSHISGYHSGLGLSSYSHSADPIRRYPDLYNQYLLHKFYFKDIDFDFNEEDFIKIIEYFNQRNTELNLLRSEYSRTLKKS